MDSTYFDNILKLLEGLNVILDQVDKSKLPESIQKLIQLYEKIRPYLKKSKDTTAESTGETFIPVIEEPGKRLNFQQEISNKLIEILRKIFSDSAFKEWMTWVHAGYAAISTLILMWQATVIWKAFRFCSQLNDFSKGSLNAEIMECLDVCHGIQQKIEKRLAEIRQPQFKDRIEANLDLVEEYFKTIERELRRILVSISDAANKAALHKENVKVAKFTGAFAMVVGMVYGGVGYFAFGSSKSLLIGGTVTVASAGVVFCSEWLEIDLDEKKKKLERLKSTLEKIKSLNEKKLDLTKKAMNAKIDLQDYFKEIEMNLIISFDSSIKDLDSLIESLERNN